MDNEQLFIAPKIKVGFQNREDTYTKKLAYVVYYDLKGTLRKEKSWESWRDHKIEPVEFENTPTEGFVLNKKVGGGRSDWNVRQEYVRVYDPRNFEFEITVPNLLFILKECDCSRGKGLEGKFVYAWSGTTLILLPASSEEYKKSAGYTNLQAKTILAKELVKGAAYLTKKQEKRIYIDRRVRYNKNVVEGCAKEPVELVYVFWDENSKDFVFDKDTKKLAAVISDTPDSSYAELVQKYDKSIHGSPPVKLFTKEQAPRKSGTDPYWHRHEWTKEESPGVFQQYSTQYGFDGSISSVASTYKVSLQDVSIHIAKGTKYVTAAGNHNHHYYDRLRRYDSGPEITPVDLGLWVELASGSNFKINGTQVVLKGDTDG